jgi:hypothetical protein
VYLQKQEASARLCESSTWIIITKKHLQANRDREFNKEQYRALNAGMVEQLAKWCLESDTLSDIGQPPKRFLWV